jgi:hypothetical protein
MSSSLPFEDHDQSQDADASWVVQLYASCDPSGEIALPYNHPAGASFVPICEGYLGNVSQLVLRFGWLWAWSACLFGLSIPFAEGIMLNSLHLPPLVRHHGFLSGHQFTPWDVLSKMFLGLCMFFLLLAAATYAIAAIYAVIMITNMWLQYGSAIWDKMRAPTHIVLSKECVKLTWAGRGFSQIGAMLAWQDMYEVDFVPSEDPLTSTKIVVKYKLADGEKLIPFALCGFATDADAALFMDMADKYIPDEMKSEEFKDALKNRDAVVKQARHLVAALLAQTPSAVNASQKTIEGQEAKRIIAALTEAQKPAESGAEQKEFNGNGEHHDYKIDLAGEEKVMEPAKRI